MCYSENAEIARKRETRKRRYASQQAEAVEESPASGRGHQRPHEHLGIITSRIGFEMIFGISESLQVFQLLSPVI
jgi:hypothetical protein